MKGIGATVSVVLAVAVLFGSPAAAAGQKPDVQHLRFESTPFLLDLSDPSGSAQCDVQLVGYDTGIVNLIDFPDRNGVVGKDITIQSLSTVLTNPDNGKVIELRMASTQRNPSSYTENADGSLTVTVEITGLNVLYRGERVVVLAGHFTARFIVRFDEQGNVTSVDYVEDFTPHLGHAYPLFCELFA